MDQPSVLTHNGLANRERHYDAAYRSEIAISYLANLMIRNRILHQDDLKRGRVNEEVYREVVTNCASLAGTSGQNTLNLNVL